MTNNYTIWPCDCRTAMSLMPENSVDSVVCDPPYGLSKEPDVAEVLKHWLAGDDYEHGGNGFMNAAWDSFVPGPAVWREAYRVLKPGGHLVAFFGTRTYDLGVMALRLAGFEVRDSLYWHYGSGFPKSHNISKKLADAEISCQCHKTSLSSPHAENQNLHGVPETLDAEGPLPSSPQPDVFNRVQSPTDLGESNGEALASENGDNNQLCGLRETEGDAFGVATESRATDMQPAMQRGVAGGRMGEARFGGIEGENARELPAGVEENDRAAQPGLEGRSHTETPEGKLQRGEVRPVPAGLHANGSEGWLHHGTPLGDGENVRFLDDQNGGGQPHRPRPLEQSSQQSGTLADERGPQAWGGWEICGGCGKPRILEGLGTALKPSTEPIVLCRKPLSERTVAANVLRWGTGAVNIDGCRVGDTVETWPKSRSYAPGQMQPGGRGATMATGDAPAGRWPANLAHDGSEEATAGMGDAQRYFYCAKASKADRNRGLDDMAEQPSAASQFRPNHAAGAAAGEEGNPYGRWKPQKNTHPTVKPTALMQWLVRLITPPGGTVLDPFMGSGSTGVAAMLEHMQFIGCEMTDEYIPIATARIDNAVSRRYHVQS